MPAELYGAGAGAALSFGLNSMMGSEQEATDRYGRDISRSLEITLRNAFQADPLMQMIMGSLSQTRGAPFDPEEVYGSAVDQLTKIRERRAFDARRSLATMGFGPGSAQEQFAQTSLDQQVGQEKSTLRGLVDSAAIGARPEQLLSGFDLFGGLLARHMATGAGFGGLGTPAGRGPAYSSGGGGLPNVDEATALSYLPSELQGQFFVA